MLLSALAAAPAAKAQSGGTLIVLRVPGDDRIVLRLRAELRRSAWRLVESSPRGEQANRSLDSLAAQHGADAALRARPRQLAVELWVAPDGNEPGHHEVLMATGPSADVGVLALRVAEALRARGIVPPTHDESTATAGAPTPTDSKKGPVSPSDGGHVLASSAPPSTTSSAPPSAADAVTPADKSSEPTAEASPATPPKPEQVKPAVEEAPPAATPAPSETDDDESSEPAAEGGETDREPEDTSLLLIEAGPALIYSPPGKVPPSGDVWFDVRLQPVRLLSLSAFGLFPVLHGPVRGDLDTPSGETMRVSVNVPTYAVGASADLQLPTGPWEWSAGLGAALLITHVSGKPASIPGIRYRNQSLYSLGLLARAGLELRISRGARIGLRALLGVATRKVEVDLSRHSASWGRPFVAVTLGLALALPWQR